MRIVLRFATALVLCGGCGDDTGGNVDARPPDAAVDARPIDGPTVDRPPVDAAPNLFSDAGDFATPVTDGSVFCGVGNIGGPCQLPNEICCFEVTNPTNTHPCIAPGADAGSCTFYLPCDGREDCPSGQNCCVTFSQQRTESNCSAGNCANPATQTSFACHTWRECPQALQACCRISIMGFETRFGACLPPTMVPMLPQGHWECDIP